MTRGIGIGQCTFLTTIGRVIKFRHNCKVKFTVLILVLHSRPLVLGLLLGAATVGRALPPKHTSERSVGAVGAGERADAAQSQNE